MTVDVAKIMRLKGAALAASQLEKGSLAGKALADTYDLVRDQIQAAIPGGLREEFEGLFPRMDQPRLRADDLIESAAAADQAKARLQTLAGWLQGVIESEKQGHG